MSAWHFLLPLGAAFGYACGAIAVKHALGRGVSGNTVNFLCNASLALLFQIFWLIPGQKLQAGALLAPVLCGLIFFLGQFFTFRAIASGDVSVATPLLGAKVILVALFSVLFTGTSLPSRWWLASGMASLGVALVSYSPGGNHKHLVVTVCWSLGAAALFALTDVFVQHGVPRVGYARFAPIMFGVMGICSLVYLPTWIKETRPLRQGTFQFKGPASGWLWLAVGGTVLSLQALAFYSAIGIYGSATLSNILYGSRCLWSVFLVWVLGPLAGGVPLDGNRSLIMGSRFAGALLLFTAMALVLH